MSNKQLDILLAAVDSLPDDFADDLKELKNTNDININDFLQITSLELFIQENDIFLNNFISLHKNEVNYISHKKKKTRETQTLKNIIDKWSIFTPALTA